MQCKSTLLASVAILSNLHRSVEGTATSPSNSVTGGSFGGCPQISPGPEPLFNLPTDFPPPVIQDASTTEAIRQTLALYPFTVDGRNWNALTRIFATNARANYSAPLGVLNGVQQIIDVLSQDLEMFVSTQHHFGTQFIDVCSPNTAVSITYFRAAHFSTPYVSASQVANLSQVLYAYGQYQDTWDRQDDQTWKITNRNLVYMVSISVVRTRK